MLHPEFQNPLFLRLLCEGIKNAGLTRIPVGLQGITSIIDFFIKNVNDVLSQNIRLQYSDSLNLVEKAVNVLIEYKIENNLRYVPYEKGYQIIDESISKFVNFKGFIDELVEEGVLSKNYFWNEGKKPEEGVYFAFERFEDHLTSKYLIEKFPNLVKEFNEGGQLYKYVKDKHAVSINKGLIEAFSIQIPEFHGYEFSVLIPHLKGNYAIVESFIHSLLWRKNDTINTASKEYVNSFVFSYEETSNLFWETIIAINGVPDNYFNAQTLHKYLIRLTLADRDATWTIFLKDRYNKWSSVRRLIDRTLNQIDNSHISDESILLMAITLSWFHTSTNRKLRDCSTKALVCLLKERIEVLIEVLKSFENVNDPYVMERLYAVAYGCAVRTTKKELLVNLSNYIYQTVFNKKDEIYPHILLRDYARGVIEITINSGFELSFDYNEVRPPYKSKFSEEYPSDDEITRKYEFDYKSASFEDYYWGQNYILSSMTTEHSDKIYGDFGRYTFQCALESWDLDVNNLSNLAIKWIFERYGYDVERHGEYDRSIGSGRANNSYPNERIGKKYQWIAFYEMLARISDNYKKYDKWSFGNKAEEPYQGSWEPYVRDIDPTMLIKCVKGYDNDEEQIFWWNKISILEWDIKDEDWVSEYSELPKIEDIIQVKDENNEEWLVLEGYPDWTEPKNIGIEKWGQLRKQLFYNIKSFLVKNEEFQSIKKCFIKNNCSESLDFRSINRYEMFNREFYWSSAQSFFSSDMDWITIQEREGTKYIAKVKQTAISFLWENELDMSKEGSIRFLLPNQYIFKGMNLKYSQKEGEFLDKSDEVVCFAPNVYNDSKTYLLVKKLPFFEFLLENNLVIIWKVYGEKRIIGGRSTGTNNFERLDISGTYYFEEELKGILKKEKK